MEVCFTFQWGRFVFQMAGGGGGGSFIYKWGGVPHREATLVLMGGVKKNCKMRGALAPSMPLPHHYGEYWKPCVLILNFYFACFLLLCMHHVLCMYVLFYKHY